MQVASRPRLNAGIALVGASVIAVCPLAPPLPDIHLPNPAHVVASVELAAASLAAAPPSYAQVIQEAVANAQALLTTFAANPTPILSQVARNQAITIQNLTTALQTTGGAIGTALTTTVPPLLQTAFNDLASGNVEGAINNVLGATLATAFPITGFIPAVSAAFTQPLTNLVNAINAVQVGLLGTGATSPLGFAVTGLLGPVLSGAGAFGVSVDNVGSAIAAGDPEAVLNAVVHGPATILDGVLNGGFGPDLSSLAGLAGIKVVAGGLLSGGLAVNSAGAIQLPGLINSLQALATAFANALATPTVPATTTAEVKSLSTSPAAIPAAGATTLALTTAPAKKAIEAPAAKAATDTSAPAKDSSATDASATDGTTKSSTSSTDATDSSTSSAASSKGDTTTKGDPADSTAASGSSSTGDTSTKGATSTKSGGDTKGGSNAKGDGGAKKSGDTGSKSGSNSKSSGGGGRHRK